ncbi:hypothetical protein BaRGS_00000625 [Batillaria attramentaria]|uniref:Secreted protein n=1 Tax=Batillaria attramentaria TaxID=370345 RepID=A0ABD0MAK1_9CAEN
MQGPCACRTRNRNLCRWHMATVLQMPATWKLVTCATPLTRLCELLDHTATCFRCCARVLLCKFVSLVARRDFQTFCGDTALAETLVNNNNNRNSDDNADEEHHMLLATDLRELQIDRNT